MRIFEQYAFTFAQHTYIYCDGVIFFLYFSYRCNYIITQLLVLSVTVSFLCFILFYDYCVQLFFQLYCVCVCVFACACACGSAYLCTFEWKQLDIVHSKMYKRCVLLFLYLFHFCMHTYDAHVYVCTSMRVCVHIFLLLLLLLL